MRLICEFGFDGMLTLPIHYNHLLQGFIYKNLTDNALRTFLHEVGFQNGKRSYKLFTYSRILGKSTFNPEEKTISFYSPIKLHISSFVDPFIQDLSNTFFKSNSLFLGEKGIELRSITVKEFSPKEPKVKIRMLSPIVTYRTAEIDRKNKTIYFSPRDWEFSEQVRQNLLRKYMVVYGKEPEDDAFTIEYIGKEEPKLSIIRYHDTIIKGYNGHYLLQGNPELIRLGYFTGLGSKNSQGFGCFEEINS